MKPNISPLYILKLIIQIWCLFSQNVSPGLHFQVLAATAAWAPNPGIKASDCYTANPCLAVQTVWRSISISMLVMAPCSTLLELHGCRLTALMLRELMKEITLICLVIFSESEHETRREARYTDTHTVCVDWRSASPWSSQRQYQRLALAWLG